MRYQVVVGGERHSNLIALARHRRALPDRLGAKGGYHYCQRICAVRHS